MRVGKAERSGWILNAFRRYGWLEVGQDVEYERKKESSMILDQGEELVIISNTKVKVLIAISYLTLCDPMDYSPPGSSVHRILQARILGRVAIPFSVDLPNPGMIPRSPLQEDYLVHCRDILYHLRYQGSSIINWGRLLEGQIWGGNQNILHILSDDC